MAEKISLGGGEILVGLVFEVRDTELLAVGEDLGFGGTEQGSVDGNVQQGMGLQDLHIEESFEPCATNTVEKSTFDPIFQMMSEQEKRDMMLLEYLMKTLVSPLSEGIFIRFFFRISLKNMQRRPLEKLLHIGFFLFALRSEAVVAVDDVEMGEGEVLVVVSQNEESSETHAVHAARNSDGDWAIFRDVGCETRENFLMDSQGEIRFFDGLELLDAVKCLHF